jgi:hypothetical protein
VRSGCARQEVVGLGLFGSLRRQFQRLRLLIRRGDELLLLPALYLRIDLVWRTRSPFDLVVRVPRSIDFIVVF